MKCVTLEKAGLTESHTCNSTSNQLHFSALCKTTEEEPILDLTSKPCQQVQELQMRTVADQTRQYMFNERKVGNRKQILEQDHWN